MSCHCFGCTDPLGLDSCTAKNRPMSPDAAGKVVLIAVKIGYPGSRISDILIGDHKTQVNNADLRSAAALAVDPEGSYDMAINTELYLGAAGDIDEDEDAKG